MKITKLGHACLFIEEAGVRILMDPGMFSKGFDELREVDAILITHQHPDHITPEILAAVRLNNPAVKVYADAGTAKLFADSGDATLHVVLAGEAFEVEGVKVAAFGTRHAVIHPAIPGIENVGYLVAERLFYPGDNFTVPGVPVEILALPLGAPWLKVSEVIDYVGEVKPRVAIPVHDAVLAMPEMHIGMVQKFAEAEGTAVRVVPNGETLTV